MLRTVTVKAKKKRIPKRHAPIVKLVRGLHTSNCRCDDRCRFDVRRKASQSRSTYLLLPTYLPTAVKFPAFVPPTKSRAISTSVSTTSANFFSVYYDHRRLPIIGQTPIRLTPIASIPTAISINFAVCACIASIIKAKVVVAQDLPFCCLYYLFLRVRHM